MCLLQNDQVQGNRKILRLLVEFSSPPKDGVKKDPLSDDDGGTLGLQYKYCCISFKESDYSEMYDTWMMY
jgi:hypothetical protein